MEIVSDDDTSIAKVATSASTSIKVCMHVRGPADGRVMRAAIALAEEGFDISIFTVERERSQHLLEEGFSGVHVIHTFLSTSFISRYFKLWPLIKTMQSHIYSTYRLMRIPADIYHAHDWTALPACFIAARLRRKPLIFDAHELPLSELEGSYWHRLRKLLAWLLSVIVPYCDGVITVSPPIAQEIRSRYHSSEVLVVRNIPGFQAVPKSNRLRQYLGLSPVARIALYQGNLQPDRWLDRLIRAAPFLEQDIIIVLMGKGVGATPSQLQALIATEGVTDRVKIIPPVPYAELLDWTSSADIGLIIYPPSYSLNTQMCLPNKLFEYLMAGLPILASPLDAVSDVINTYNVGQILPSLASADIGATINVMLTERVALARLHYNALEAVKQELNWEMECQHLIRLYHNILIMRNTGCRGRKTPSNPGTTLPI